MNALTRHLEQYLELRHRLGFKLDKASRQLHQFVRFAQEAKAPYITTALAIRWATQSTNCQPVTCGARLGMVRQFARYLRAVDPRHEMPPEGLLPGRCHRKTPYLYRDEQVVQLLQAAQQMSPGLSWSHKPRSSRKSWWRRLPRSTLRIAPLVREKRVTNFMTGKPQPRFCLVGCG